jgi:tetratricopeptide (TPR) repeat protein
MSRLVLAALLIAPSIFSQTSGSTEGPRYVMPNGPGAISVALTGGWTPQQLSLLDNGARLVLQMKNKQQSLVASYIIFPNDTGAPTAESCRDAVIAPIVANLKSNATLTPTQHSTHKMPDGRTLAIASYLIEKAANTSIQQQNAFGFLGDAHTCAEIHVSKIQFKPTDQPLIDITLDAFSFNPTYAAIPADYGIIATLFYNYFQDYKSSAIYYQRALDTLPEDAFKSPAARLLARVTVDQLSMSYGLSGDLKRSREVNEAAIAKDPDYPLYYYNLACADAESGNATEAKLHLQQAFDRRANTIKGETLPDPTADDSILKLKDDKAFWAFVQSLPKS